MTLSSDNEARAEIGSLSQMLDHDIARSGPTESFMIRAGLLRQILDELVSHRAETFDQRLSAICDEGWQFHAGPPPEYGSPLEQVYDAGIGYAWDRLAEMLGVTDYEGGDGSEDYATDVANTGRNILVAAGYANEDGDLLTAAELKAAFATTSHTVDREDLLELADKAVAWALDNFGGYECDDVDAGIHYMQARGKDRWSMQAQMELPPCFGCDGTTRTLDGELCPVCQPEPYPPVIPEGYVLVPREPTEAMILAGAHKIDWHRSDQAVFDPYNPFNRSDGSPVVGTTPATDLLDAWSAMLSANPLSPSKQSDANG